MQDVKKLTAMQIYVCYLNKQKYMSLEYVHYLGPFTTLWKLHACSIYLFYVPVLEGNFDARLEMLDA